MAGASTVVAVTAEAASIARYWFLGVSGSVTVTGYFLTATGLRTGLSFSTTIPAGNGTNDAVRLIATDFPTDAVGAIVRFSGNAAFDLNSGTSDDFEDNYANYPYFGTSSGNCALGDVAVV